MTRIVSAEIYKLRTTPGPWVTVLLAVPLTVLSILIVFASGGAGLHQVETLNQQRLLLGSGYRFGVYLAPILGLLCVTTEYRHKVITTTLLVTPRRERVLLGKALASALGGVVIGLLSLVTVLAVGLPWNAAMGGAAGPVLDQFGAVTPGLFAALVLMTLFGLGFGTLVRNQIAAILLTVGFTLVLEPIIVALVLHFFSISLNWLPSDASAALAGTLHLEGMGGGGGGLAAFNLLPWWGGGLALLGWGLVPLVVGYYTTFSRDVT